MSLTALKKLVESSKATVLVAVELIMGLMVYRGLMTVEQFLSTTQILVPAWMVAHAGENGAKALANGKAKPAEIAKAILASPVNEENES